MGLPNKPSQEELIDFRKRQKVEFTKRINSLQEYVETIGGSRETSLVRTKLEEAELWAEKHFRNLGV